ncbi:hypothetical protein MKW98_004185 [Papaver atlanticum]|uniref:Uncharacterized protein n=1 Tax=Papaver atlanticum TaxID=357466 RepID=A0AAD4T8F7_9MAGN|nr:hypothetical protein MKW98_004185 [Papaver atlanticum]
MGFSSDSFEENSMKSSEMFSEDAVGFSESMVEDSQLIGEEFKSLDDISEFNEGSFPPTKENEDITDSGSSRDFGTGQIPSRNSTEHAPICIPICTPSSDFFAEALVDK